MNIKELAKKYELVEGDFWNHKQSGQWILTHDAVEKIATKEGIRLVNIETLNSEPDLVRFLITMVKDEVTITSVGEADRNNCFSQYLGCMAEKRGVDRCVLKLINAYEYGISSEVEAEDFKRPAHYQKTEHHIEQFAANLEHPYFDGKKKETKKAWDDADSLTKAEFILTQMNQRIENYKESK
jgi:hypothetical protein